MAQEIEAKILKIDRAKLEEKLVAIGAHKERDIFFRSTSFDFPGLTLAKESAWVRLRDDGTTITLAYKKRLGADDKKLGGDAGMEEIEVSVSDYETTIMFLKKIGMIEKFSQEKKRAAWVRGALHFDIDEWPRLAPYLEVEGPTWDEVDAAIKELGIDLKDKVLCSATQVYEMNGIDDHSFSKMTFTEWITKDGKKIEF